MEVGFSRATINTILLLQLWMAAPNEGAFSAPCDVLAMLWAEDLTEYLADSE